jgi:hypothetical protein
MSQIIAKYTVQVALTALEGHSQVKRINNWSFEQLIGSGEGGVPFSF